MERRVRSLLSPAAIIGATVSPTRSPPCSCPVAGRWTTPPQDQQPRL